MIPLNLMNQTNEPTQQSNEYNCDQDSLYQGSNEHSQHDKDHICQFPLISYEEGFYES